MGAYAGRVSRGPFFLAIAWLLSAHGSLPSADEHEPRTAVTDTSGPTAADAHPEVYVGFCIHETSAGESRTWSASLGVSLEQERSRTRQDQAGLGGCSIRTDIEVKLNRIDKDGVDLSAMIDYSRSAETDLAPQSPEVAGTCPIKVSLSLREYVRTKVPYNERVRISTVRDEAFDHEATIDMLVRPGEHVRPDGEKANAHPCRPGV
jgi:hypothetical protein